MWKLVILLYICCVGYAENDKIEDPALYYYGIEESERSLPACASTQTCSVRLERYWQPAAVVRLCRCARRLQCPAHDLLDDRALELNNRAQFKFCEPVTSWPDCALDEKAVAITAGHRTMDPDNLEDLHHQNIHIQPPNITFNCRCRYPYTWKLTDDNKTFIHYKCSELAPCQTGDFCGNVRDDISSLYQSCLCPLQHMCVHNGGVDYVNVSEILYEGRGRRAYCQRFGNSSDEDEDY